MEKSCNVGDNDVTDFKTENWFVSISTLPKITKAEQLIYKAKLLQYNEKLSLKTDNNNKTTKPLIVSGAVAV